MVGHVSSFLAAVGAVVLGVAGVSKWLSPAPTRVLMGRLRLPTSIGFARSLAAIEIAIGAAALLLPTRVAMSLLAGSYVILAFIVSWLLSHGAEACGCFGRRDEPPTRLHVVLNSLFAAVALAEVVRGSDPLLADVHADAGALVVALAAIAGAAWAVHATYTLRAELIGARSLVRNP